jgi:crotonobetaine/carnitine-CoA ligase
MVIPSLPGLLAERSRHTPDGMFLQDVGGASATWRQAHDQALAWAGGLRALGVSDGDCVITMLPSSVDATTAWIGLSVLGAREAPINTDLRGHLLVHAISTVSARVMVVAETFLAQVVTSVDELDLDTLVVLGTPEPLPELGCRVITAHDLLSTSEPLREPADGQPWDIATVLFTSGTTGPSKAVLVPWTQLYAFCCRLFPDGSLTADDVLWAVGPAYHMGAKAWPLLGAMLGARVVINPSFNAKDWWTQVSDFGCTTTAMVGTMAAYLCQAAEPAPEDADTPLRNVVMAPLVADPAGFAARFGVRVCTVYGMTELSTPFSTEGWVIDDARSCGKVRPGFPGYEVRLVDEHDQVVDDGELGELIVRTDAPWALNAGYLGRPEDTARAWRNGWFHTGDLFRRDERGNYFFCDRAKDAIRRRGENISSFEVEAHVNAFPDVLESAAIAVPSGLGEEDVKVVVVPRPGSEVDPVALLEFLIPRMPRFMIPRYVEVAAALPKTATQKVSKAILRAAGRTASTWDREAAGIRVPR